MEPEKNEFKLQDAVAKKYKMGEGQQPTKMILSADYGREEVDFGALSLEEADALVARLSTKEKPFRYLIPVGSGAVANKPV